MARSKKTNYGWKPDLPDHRDFKYGEKCTVTSAGTYPQTVDLRSNCSPVEDQKQLGSCTANALVGNLEYLEVVAKSKPFVDLSRLFLYYNERSIEGDVKDDNGAQLRDGVKALVKWGICAESIWPYNSSAFAKKPTKPCYTQAVTREISQYMRLNTLDDMLHCLSSGFPFVFGFTVYDYFESAEMAQTGILKMPSPNESSVGGHAVCAVGYDQTKKMFLIRNSWGADWGFAGYFWMPFAYLTDRNLSDDLWTIRK